MGCEAQDAPPEPKAAKLDMVEKAYEGHSVVTEYDAALAARKAQLQPKPPPEPPKKTVSIEDLFDKLKKVAIQFPDKVRQYWKSTQEPKPPKPPDTLQARDWINWATQTKEWLKKNKEAFRKWVEPLVAKALPEKKPPKPGRAPMSMFLDEAANVMRAARSVAVFKEVLKKYEKQIEQAYKDDVKQFPELEQVARPWMNAFERFRQALEAGDLNAAKSAVTDMMLSWRNWNLRRRMLRGE